MKRFWTFAAAILVCALILLPTAVNAKNARAQTAITTPAVGTAQPSQPACDPSRNIQVSGTAVINVVPDRALIQLGVQSNGKSPKDVQARNSATISQVTKALKAMGIEARDISTDWYIIEPLYEEYDSLRIKGYRIHNIVAVTLKDVGKANDVIVTAMQSGANQVVNVEFYTSELRKYRDQAREMAMKAAAEKAQALARAAGADAVCILNITENTSSRFNGWGWWGYGNNQALWTQNVMQNATAGGEELQDDGPVNLGHISITAQVGATFGLK
jgi:hypothetical protein